MVWFHVRMWCSSTSTTNISTKRTTIYHVGKWFQFNDAEMFARAASHLSPWKMIFNCGSVTPKRPQVPHTDTPRAPHNGSLWGRVAHPWADLALQSCHLRNGQTSKLKGTLPIIEENGFSSTMLTCLHVLTLTCHRGKCKSWSSTADLIATHTQTHHLRLTTALCGDVLRTLEQSLNCRAVTWDLRNGQTSKLKGTLAIIEETGFSSTLLKCLHVLLLTCAPLVGPLKWTKEINQ